MGAGQIYRCHRTGDRDPLLLCGRRFGRRYLRHRGGVPGLGQPPLDELFRRAIGVGVF